MCTKQTYSLLTQGFRYFAEKKQDFAGISGANSRKNRPISREKSQNSLKNWPISREILGGNFAKKQSDKNSQFRWIFVANFAKIDQ